MLVAGLFSISLSGASIVHVGTDTFREILSEIANPGKATSAAGLKPDEPGPDDRADRGPIAAICMGTECSRGQVGFRPSPKSLKIDFKRIDPIAGAKNLIGPNLIFEHSAANC